MKTDIYTYNIPVQELPDGIEFLFKVLKLDQAHAKQEITGMVSDLLNKSKAYMKIKGGFRLFENGHISINEKMLRCDQLVFKSDVTVARQLAGSSGLVFFAATLGSVFDTWIHHFFGEDDPFSGYVADLIGSIKTEQAVDWLENKISSLVKEKGLSCTNRFSPGYCGWDVAEQHKLFSLFPENFLGISLTSSALMTPIKSVSGVIGTGERVKKVPYTCKFCDQPNCFMRRSYEKTAKAN
jgi:hypothetical protein